MQRRVTDFYSAESSSSAGDLPRIGGLTRLNLSKSATCSPMSSPLTPTANGRKRKARTSTTPAMKQTILDAGQSKIGLQHCAKCGMVYNIDDKRDVDNHDAFHNRFAGTKFFRVTVGQLETWKDCLCWEYARKPMNGIIFRLSAASSATLRKRVEDLVNSAVNDATGYCADLPVWDQERRRQALVFVVVGENEPPFVGALALIDAVGTATLMPERKNFRGQFIGVNRIWTHEQLRRRGLATALLDFARRFAVGGGSDAPLPRTRVAFIDPTEAGARLARRYLSAAGKQPPPAGDGGGDEAGSRYIVHQLHTL